MSSRPPAEAGGPRRVAVLGSTGSIGTQALDVLAAHPDAFEVVALVAGRNRTLPQEQAARHRRAVAASGADDPHVLEDVATRPDVDLVVVATGGIVSLGPVLAALRSGKVVATANKETLVAGGHLVLAEAWARAA